MFEKLQLQSAMMPNFEFMTHIMTYIEILELII
jgi:hypothetical protein